MSPEQLIPYLHHLSRCATRQPKYIVYESNPMMTCDCGLTDLLGSEPSSSRSGDVEKLIDQLVTVIIRDNGCSSHEWLVQMAETIKALSSSSSTAHEQKNTK